MHGRRFCLRWIIRGWPGPSAGGLGPRLALNKPCHPRIRDWHGFAMPVTDASPSADGMGPRLAPNSCSRTSRINITNTELLRTSHGSAGPRFLPYGINGLSYALFGRPWSIPVKWSADRIYALTFLFPPSIAFSTIERIFHLDNIKKWPTKKRPKLAADHAEARFHWALDHKD